MAQRTIKPIEFKDLPQTIQLMKSALKLPSMIFTYKLIFFESLWMMRTMLFYSVLHISGCMLLIMHIGLLHTILALFTLAFACVIAVIGLVSFRDQAQKRSLLEMILHVLLFLFWPVATWFAWRKKFTHMKQVAPDLRKDARYHLFVDVSEGIDHWNTFIEYVKSLSPEESKQYHHETRKELIELEDKLRYVLAQMHAHLAMYPLHIPLADVTEDCKKIQERFDDFHELFVALFEDDEEETTDA